jgi:GNAT superfamily N-acetyltransferase
VTRWSARTRARLLADSPSAQVTGLVAGREGQVHGFCFFGAGRDANLAGIEEIYAVYVHPAHWSTGLGHALLSAALSRLSRPVILWVLEANHRARAFYERVGFGPDGAVKPAALLDATLPEVRYRLD